MFAEDRGINGHKAELRDNPLDVGGRPHMPHYSNIHNLPVSDDFEASTHLSGAHHQKSVKSTKLTEKTAFTPPQLPRTSKSEAIRTLYDGT